jgi:hypothetical protein
VTSQQPLDQLPVILFLAIFIAVNVAVYEIGFRLGSWTKQRDPEGDDGPTGLVVGSVLGLMAFLLAITMGMASDRFDTRRGLVLAETNAIGTAYLRAGYLSEPASADSQALLREYVPHRIATSDRAEVAANVARSEEIHAELWTIAEEVARTEGSDVVALYIEALNEVIDLHTNRVVAGVYSRVPPTILWLLVTGVVLSLGLVGYNAGLGRKRNPMIAAVLVLSLGAVIWLVVDLDRPQDGLITTSQQPLIDLQEQLESSP